MQEMRVETCVANIVYINNSTNVWIWWMRLMVLTVF